MSEKTDRPRKNWDFSQNLQSILEKHTLELSDEELEEVSLSIRDNIPENTIKEWLQLPLSCMHQKRLSYSHKHYNSDISSNEFGYSGNIHVPMVLLLDAIPHKIPEHTELSLLDSEELLCSIGKCTQGHVHFQLNYTWHSESYSFYGKLYYGNKETNTPILDCVRDSTLQDQQNPILEKFILSEYGASAAESAHQHRQWILDSLIPYLREHERFLTLEKDALLVLHDDNSSTQQLKYYEDLLEYIAYCCKCLNAGKTYPKMPHPPKASATNTRRRTIKTDIAVQKATKKKDSKSTIIPFQHRMSDLLNVNRPLVIQAAFQEIVCQYRNNSMHQDADLLISLAILLDAAQKYYRQAEENYLAMLITFEEMGDFFCGWHEVTAMNSQISNGIQCVTAYKNRLAYTIASTLTETTRSSRTKLSALYFLKDKFHLLTNLEKLQDQMLQTERVLDRVFLQLNFSRQMVEKSAQGNTDHNLTPQELLKYIPWNLEDGIIGSLQQRLYAMERTIRRLQKTAKQLHLQLSETNPKMKPNYLYL